GAMDDAGGVFVAWEALRTIRQALQEHRTRRTIRLILFSGEELGLWAAGCTLRLSYMLETDGGTFDPRGVTCSGSAATTAALRTVLQPLESSLGACNVFEKLDGPDITEWASVGVPVGNLVTQRTGESADFYFQFHHSRGDTVSVQDPFEMDRCTAVMAV
uniref:Carboxypeptidase Q n=1 Tax=Macrostomum lignano TaxID=282301 RepID=A0A1I8I125_9PLAT